MSDHWIRASEISNYVYCRRAWWLQRQGGHHSQNIRELQTGTQYHQQHSQTWLRSLWGRRLAYLLLFLFVAFITFQFLSGMQ
ncbi:MAG: Dna2/Cas4 domain-containing protein [Chloroflexi bacterium]|nr:Dna2/Cas4 domain-containing protein [Chloroflexota bacterium]